MFAPQLIYRNVLNTLKRPEVQAAIKRIIDRDRIAGVEAAIAIIEERGERIRGAIQPDRTVAEIRERLLDGR